VIRLTRVDSTRNLVYNLPRRLGSSVKQGPSHGLLDRMAPLAFFVAMCVALSIFKPSFAQPANLLAIVRQYSVIIVLAIGQTLLMISGGIDLSVGSVVALSGIVAGVCHQHGLGPGLSIAAALGVGILAGLTNGLVTTKARMPAFIATLGMMGIARGTAQVLSGAQSIDVSPSIAAIGQNQWFFAAVIIAVCIVTWVALTRTPFGRHCYAVGSNKEATRLSGVNVDRHMIKAFLFTGTIVGIAGVLMMARVGLANPTGSEGYELDSIAAAVIGGTSLFGGQGTVAGTLIGGLIMAVLRNGCNLLDIDSNWQLIIIGAMIILAVFYDNVRRRGR